MIRDAPSKKRVLRLHYQSCRKNLPFNRREEAKRELVSVLVKLLEGKKRVGSFCSIGSEIDMHSINRLLCQEGRLALPLVKGKEMWFVHADTLEDWEKGKKEEVDVVLVPGIVFDQERNRIGYGKGYYDRFLATYRPAASIGVGFKEQYSPKRLPVQPHDIVLTSLCLV